MTPQTNDLPHNQNSLSPDVGSCLGNAWNVMWKKFLELLLITILAILLSFALFPESSLLAS